MDPQDIVGKIFGDLEVLSVHHKNDHANYFYHCLCECGKKTIVLRSNLVNRRTLSCGCGANRSATEKYNRWISKADRLGSTYKVIL